MLLPRTVPVKHLLKTLKLAAAAERRFVYGGGPIEKLEHRDVHAKEDGAEEEEEETADERRVTLEGLRSYISNLDAVKSQIVELPWQPFADAEAHAAAKYPRH